MPVYDISLADLRQGISAVIATEMVLKWNSGPKSPEQHQRLMEPYKVRGTVASSDSAGLSRLTQQYSLAQVLKLISEPKEEIHALGKAIGGESVGIWAADNTFMFYPDSVPPAQIVSQMLVAQRKLTTRIVRVGIGIHFCSCYRIAGGLFGPDIDMIEEIAEDRTAGGEIVLSQAVHEQLADPVRQAVRRRGDLANYGGFFSLSDYQGPLTEVAGTDVHYPTPFDASFFAKLRSTPLAELGQECFACYGTTRTVAFVYVRHRRHEFLLDAFTDMSLVDIAFRRVAASHDGDVVKSNGILAIVLFESGSAALAFSRDVIITARKLGVSARVGMTYGESYVFPLSNGSRDIAGNTINIASKLAEDTDLDGILIESSVQDADRGAASDSFRITLSRVELTGHRILV